MTSSRDEVAQLELVTERVRVGFECPQCGGHHTVEMSKQSAARGLSWTQCPTFPKLGWIRLENP